MEVIPLSCIRKRPRFSLRFILLVVAFSALIFAVFASRYHNVQARRDIIAGLGPHSCFSYCYQTTENGVVTYNNPPGPNWLRRLLGDDFFATLRMAELNGVVTDEVLGHVSKLNELQSLTICDHDGKITDSGLNHLTRLHKIEFLIIHSDVVTYRAVVPLTALPRLRRLIVFSEQISNEDGARLVKLNPVCEVIR